MAGETNGPSGAESTPGVVLLDGGLSNALEDRGHDVRGSLWTARLLRDAPDEIAAVHRTYFEAGADVVTAASYQASVPGFVAAGCSEAEAERLLARSVGVARGVRDELAVDGVARWVAASVGPYGAALADGSEYRGRYGVDAAALRDFHAPRLESLVAAGPDVLAVETIPDMDEAEVLAELLDEFDCPAWFSYSGAGARTCAGQPLSEAFVLAASARAVVAVGVNCCRPADVLPAVETAARTTRLPVVAYPNSGREWDARARAWHGRPHLELDAVTSWVASGARLIGGCCGVGPADITRIAATLGGARPDPPWRHAREGE